MYEIKIIPQTFICWGKDEDEALNQLLNMLKEYKEMFVIKKVNDENER